MLRFQKACPVCRQPLHPACGHKWPAVAQRKKPCFWYQTDLGLKHSLASYLLWALGQSLYPVPLSVVLREIYKLQGIYVPPALNPTHSGATRQREQMMDEVAMASGALFHHHS